MITTQTELDVSPGGIAPVIHVSQYDTGSRTLLFNLIATAGDLILPGGTKSGERSRTGMASPMNARSAGKPSLPT